eukprot:s3107_g11.t1
MVEKNTLSDALDHSRKQVELYELSMEQITKESRKKVHEANQAKAESDLRLKNTEHDVMKRVEAIKNAETEVIAKLRMESSINVSTRARMEQYESMYENERILTEELKAELKVKDSQLRKTIQDGPSVSDRKAMAIIMDERGEHRDIDEVLVIIGPALDIKIKMEMEDDDPVREVFVENYVQHVVGRYGKRGNIMCITVPVEERDK